jgi:hypothetical protein
MNLSCYKCCRIMKVSLDLISLALGRAKVVENASRQVRQVIPIGRLLNAEGNENVGAAFLYAMELDSAAISEVLRSRLERNAHGAAPGVTLYLYVERWSCRG